MGVFCFNRFYVFLLVCVSILSENANASWSDPQTALPGSTKIRSSDEEEVRLRVVFWNVENLFDCKDDTLRQDDEFLPQGSRHWSFYRYRQKLINTAKVLIAAGEGEIPVLIGLCEVENDSVLNDLLRLTPLKQFGYRHLITTSPDPRGINVALLYKRDRFKPIARTDHRVALPSRYRPTRDILHVAGLIPGGDTLDVFVCHLPSRSGGEAETRIARMTVAEQLKQAIDSTNQVRTKSNILICGDMNDYPSTSCISTLEANHPNVDNQKNDSTTRPLFNLMIPLQKNGKGTHKYNGKWGYLDHFVVNGALCDRSDYPFVENVREFSLPFLLTEDTKHGGDRPLRTYHGYRYEGGYSDHLPILLDLVVPPR